MMTKLVDGDTVLVKHSIFTDGKWEKGQILKINDFYEIRLSNGSKTLVINKTNIIYDINIIKVSSDFNMDCDNCKHCEKYGYEDPCRKCCSSYSYWKPDDDLLKNNDKLIGLTINTFSIDEGAFITTNKKENKTMKQQQKKRDRNIIKVKYLETKKIKEIMFNGPATIIKWKPTFDQLAWDKKPDKTVVVCKEPDKFDKTTGFLLAVLKEVLDNKSYGNILEKIDEIKEFDEFSKQTVEADLEPKHNNKTELHCSIKDLKEQTEALENVYVPGSVVKYKNGKKYYKVLYYRFDEDLKEIVYILQTYKGTCFTNNDLEGTYKRNIPHSKLIRVRRK